MVTDPVARLILDEAGVLASRVLVVDDVDAALTLAARDAGASVATWCDDVRAEASIPAECRADDLVAAAADADLVLWRLPRALSAVEDVAERLAARASERLRVVAGARVKHMTRAQNAALGRSFAQVSASLGRDKSRVLHAAQPTPGTPRWPARHPVAHLDLDVIAHGTVFSTNRLDAGTRLLVDAIAADQPDPGDRALDWGSGSGIVAAWLARVGFDVLATDVSRDAIASTRLTAQANGVEVATLRTAGLDGLGPESVDLLVSNPPFHIGGAKDSTPTLEMLADAPRVLAPGGELWLVWNAHLPYLPALRRIGETRIVARDRSYVVTRTRRR